MCTAQLLHTRFYTQHPDRLEFSKTTVCITCMFLACKAEETVKKLRDIILAAHTVIFPEKDILSADDHEIEVLRADVIRCEAALLEMLNFCFDFPHPHPLVVKFGKCLKAYPCDFRRTHLDHALMTFMFVMSSNAWLLRLFTSQFFNSWLAVTYLDKYLGSVGIQHYLCRELRRFPLEEIEFFLPQLCHLLLTRPDESVALEALLLDFCESSTHICLIMVWYLQSYLSDFGNAPHSPSFRLCRRMLVQCQEIIFSDETVEDDQDNISELDSASSGTVTVRGRMNAIRRLLSKDGPLGTMRSRLSGKLGSRLWRIQVRENAPAALVGMGSILGAVASPILGLNAGEIAMIQGRRSRLDSQAFDTQTMIYQERAESSFSASDSKLNKANGPGTESEDIEDSSKPAQSEAPLLANDDGQADQSVLSQGNTAVDLTQSLPSLAISRSATSTAIMTDHTALTLPDSLLHHSSPSRPPTLEEFYQGKAFSVKRYYDLEKTRHARNESRNLPSSATHSLRAHRQRAATLETHRGASDDQGVGSDTVGRHGAREPSANPLLRQSYPASQPPLTSPVSLSFDETRRGSGGGSRTNGTSEFSHSDDPSAETLPYPATLHRNLLHRHYFQSELQFVLSLTDISNRLVVVSRQDRQSSLKAELLLLNHNLPANVCLPLWCSAKDKYSPHHKIVRIAPTDAVVLNSAERAPYLIMVEVVETDQSVEELAALGKMQSSQRLPVPSASQKPVPTALVDLTQQAFVAAQDLAGGSMAESSMRLNQREKEKETSVLGDGPLDSQRTPVDNDGPIDSSSFSPSGQTTGTSDTILLDLSTVDLADQHPSVHQDSPILDSSTVESPRELSNSLMASNTHHQQEVHMRRNSTNTEDFQERMRTAAVLLAQLAQQEERTKSWGRWQSTSGAGNAANLSHHLLVHGKGGAGTSGDIGVPSGTAADGAARTYTSAQGMEEIRARIIQEMMMLEEQRKRLMDTPGGHSRHGSDSWSTGAGPVESNPEVDVSGATVSSGALSPTVPLEGDVLEDQTLLRDKVKHKDDPSAAIFREDWDAKVERIRVSSPYGHLPGWRLFSVIVKTGADLRQEQFALQLIKEMQRIWESEGLDIWVQYYRILVLNDSSGLVETIKNTMSIHSLKKEAYSRRRTSLDLPVFTLYDYYLLQYGAPNTDSFLKAQDNFMRSLVGYSLISYILQLKDRHNGNILVDKEGHLVHIDFGFMLTNSPGSMGFEMAPFKLSQEYIDVLGGLDGVKFTEFRDLMVKGFLALRKYADNIILLVDMMQKDSKLPCFVSSSANASAALKERFQINLTETQVNDYVDNMIVSSCCNVFTRLYDTFQYYSNGIL
ncbi:Phosphatidylinositol 4-kinase pik1alpha (PI4-kinase)(PtdIns-4-kinase) [Dispira parvispora]|uniref:1-phosphatidylinositol 4-kinase n=1 Tax=Dispira parvispora TaxID=1520584 RepID=A0A9W8B0E8_9FUNG|nr:Phosphatidylinositol 4-kinase pik1alpha (PI4-kinase)(PtdIns-4-kinase) [Dispira parvispora]